jgi:uncharacterized integral membrane protein
MTEENKTNGKYLSLILAILLIGILVALFLQNSSDTEINFLFINMRIATNILVPFCVLIGFLLGVGMMFSGRWRLYRANKKLKKELENLKKEKDNFIEP